VDILGIGPLELIVILILALVVFGPDRLPEIGAKLGKGLRSMRRATREFSKEIEEARQAIEAPVEEIKKPLEEIEKPLQEIKTLAQAAQSLKTPGKAIKQSITQELLSPGDKTLSHPQGAPAQETKPTDEMACDTTPPFAPTQTPVESIEPVASSAATPAVTSNPPDEQAAKG